MTTLATSVESAIANRATQLVARYTSFGLVAWVGYAHAQADSSAAVIASAVVAGALAVADLAIHGKIFAPYLPRFEAVVGRVFAVAGPILTSAAASAAAGELTAEHVVATDAATGKIVSVSSPIIVEKGPGIATLSPPQTPSTAPESSVQSAVKPSGILILAAMLAGCGCGCSALTSSLNNPTPIYVAADQSTYSAVAPEYTAYVHADPDLDDAAKARRDRTVASWQQRIDSARPTTQPAVAAGK